MTVRPPNDGLRGLAPVGPRAPIGKMPNAQHQTFHGFMTGAPYELAVVEFDDQGRCYDPLQMDAIAKRLDGLAAGEQDAILAVFVHGWKHDARSDDENLSAFRGLLTKTAQHENAQASPTVKPRPILGIFVGWRGLSEFGLGDVVASATFWGRQAAGHRVATGSVRELFGRLRHYRNHRLEQPDGQPLLVIAGHSFGGMIVYSALCQSLIEAASAPTGELVPRFADLVLLVNPAIEAARYLPIHDLKQSDAFKTRTKKQLPVFVCAQAENDQAVGTFFPLGNASRKLTQAAIGELEAECVTRAIGFVPAFRTHRLAGPKGDKPFDLTPSGTEHADPYWVVGAAKQVINGHGGIWQPPFLSFLASLVLKHVGGGPPPPTTWRGSDDKSAGGADLAAFAREIGPVDVE